MYKLIVESAKSCFKLTILNDICTIIRYRPGQSQILYALPNNKLNAEYNSNQSLLNFIETHIEQAFISQQPFCKQYSTQEQFFIVQFIPEKEEDASMQHVLVTVQVTEKLSLDKQDIASFTAGLKLFFRKGAHDMKNLFSNVAILLHGNFIEKARSYLADLQDYYLKQIDDFYDALDTYVNTEKPSAPQIKVIDVQALVTDIVSQYQSLFNENTTLETDFQSCPHITYREDYLHSMLKSLADNAIRYRAEGRNLMIRMRTEKKGDKIIFLIEDNGIGIDMHHYKDKLFVPFQRFTRQSNGQGISLHLIKVMVEKNGGNIELESVLHQGTTVKLLLQEYATV